APRSALPVRRGGRGPPLARRTAADPRGPPPMSDAEICFLTATELARRLRAKELSAREVVAAHLRQDGFDHGRAGVGRAPQCDPVANGGEMRPPRRGGAGPPPDPAPPPPSRAAGRGADLLAAAHVAPSRARPSV